MKTVLRNEKGEITHIRIENEFFTKADAEKINFSKIDLKKFLNKTIGNKSDLLEVLLEGILNEEKTVAQLRIFILETLGEIEDKPILEV